MCTILVVSFLSFFVRTGSANRGGVCGNELQDISVFPTDDEYEQASKIYNQAYADIKPAFIAFPKNIEDVQKCLQCSNMHSVPCVAKSGGHSSGGYSTINGSIQYGFVINLAKMNSVSTFADTVVVQAGAHWEDVYNKLGGHRLVTGGLCPAVGVGGLTLGGGYSGLSRKYGMAIDNVISITMVTANGSEVVVANATANSDLYWALRGGGGGNFGVVTDITFKVHTSSYSEYVLGSLEYEAGANSQQALLTIAKLNPLLPWEVYLDVSITSKHQLHVSPIFLGSLADAEAVIKPLTDLAAKASFSNFSSYYALVFTLSEGGYNATSSEKPELLKGCVISNMNEAFVDEIFAANIPHACGVFFMHLGGAIAEVVETETAYYHRQGDFYMYVVCHYTNEEQRKQMFEFSNELFHNLEEKRICNGSYINDIDPTLLNMQEKYYGGNHQRLLEIKNQWNPIGTGSFHFLQEIGFSPQKTSKPFRHSEL